MDQLLSVIDHLYDAALDPDLWTGALAQLDLYLDTIQTFVAIEDTIDPSASYFFASVYDGAWLSRYVQSYMLINPARLALAGRVTVGDAVITTDFMTPDEYRATRFARELLAEKRIADIAVAILEQTSSRFTVLSAQRSFEQGFADETVRRKLELIMPHAQRAVKITRMFEHQRMAASTLADTLDKLSAAVFLLTSLGGLVHANQQGTALLAEADVAHTARGHFIFTDKEAVAALKQALHQAARRDDALGSGGQSIPVRTRHDRKFVATIIPLTGNRRRTIGSPADAVAAVCLKEAEFEAARGAQTLGALYGLTPRETTILVASVEIGGVSEIAAVMGISEATVRTHLKAIFRKTDATRQADLVKILTGVAGPFRLGPADGLA